jgi:hypothetical protein
VPGYEPFLLCDFHVHTRWSDGRLSIREVIDLYGKTGHFDVVAITDHILMKRDLLARAGRLASLGYCQFSVTEDRFDAYLDEISSEAVRAKRLYNMLVIPGAEITQNHIRSRKNSHIVALNLKKYISADQPADDILKDIRRQGAEHRLPSAPPDHAPRRDRHVLPLGSPQARRRTGGRLGGGQSRRPVFGNEPEALPVRREQRLPQAETPLLVEDACAMRETVGHDCAGAAFERGRRAHVVSQRLMGSVTELAGGR